MNLLIMYAPVQPNMVNLLHFVCLLLSQILDTDTGDLIINQIKLDIRN